MRLISIEGCAGAGKTSLTDYFSRELGLPKLLEQHDRNPFLADFYAGENIKLETEVTFLLIHYSQLKSLAQLNNETWAIADFSIEKDLVFAKLNLNSREFELFQTIYNYVIEQVGLPDFVIYIDLSLKVLKRRIFQRGRPYEMNVDVNYFKDFKEKLKQYFQNDSKSTVHYFDVDDLELEPNNKKMSLIRNCLSILND